MFKIVSKRSLNPTVTMMDIEAPLVARKAQAGQFIILRTDEDGERIPLTVADYDRENGNTLNQKTESGAKPKKKGFMDKLKETFED